MSIKQWLLVITMLFSLGAQAGEIITTVFNVLDVKDPAKQALLVLSGVDGKVYRSVRNEETVKYLKSLTGQVVKLNFTTEGTKNYIVSIVPVARGEVDESVYDLNHFQYNELRKFAPTNLQSLDDAKKVFDDMLNDGDKNRSQCFNRAHMWAFDMWSKMGISSQKIFMFYTARYQIVDEFEWWFHVAPVVTVAGVDYVMDGTFMTKPETVKDWTSYFMKSSKINCPAITKYSQYEDNQWTKLCYTMKTSMYYYRPLDIENRDKRNEKRNSWLLPELQNARRAFKGWEETYEGLDNGKSTTKY